ncbi:MAG TPA: winged helix-turn-helix domain-containing protein [Pyrinomonadaceae bacterium]|nr:winged helix-turn-helix domain-containing protein [Pyrinomonadaceae bacterium]
MFCFDNVTVDEKNFRLQKAGRVRSLTPRAFDVLLYLIKQDGRLVEKQEIFEQIWKESFVTDNALTRVIKEIRQAIGDDAANPIYIETVPKRGYRFAAALENKAQLSKVITAAPPTPTIAIMPFKIFGAGEDGGGGDEFLGIGMADALITRLSNSRKVAVRPTSSILHYAQTEKPPGEDFTDIFSVEDSIAERVAEALSLHLSADEISLLKKHYTENPDAHEAYLKGRFYANKFTLENFHKAIGSFERALEFDPDYALAYAGIAEANWIAADLYLNPKEALQTVKEKAATAIELDPNLAEGHTFFGAALQSIDWNWSEAEKHYRRAIELNPNFAPAHQWYGWLLSVLGRHDEAIVESEIAKRLDPFSIGVNWFLIVSYGFARQFENAAEKAQTLIDIQPYFWGGHWSLGYCCTEMGKYREALRHYKKAAEMDSSPMISSAMATAYALSGEKDKARELLDELKEAEKTGYVPPYYMAMIHAALDEADEAFICLDKAFEMRDSSLSALKVDSRLDGLRKDKRFKALVKKLGLK